MMEQFVTDCALVRPDDSAYLRLRGASGFTAKVHRLFSAKVHTWWDGENAPLPGSR